MTIEELKAISAAATKRPWNTDICRYHAADRKLIAAARNALPALLAVAEAAKEVQRVWYKNNHVVNSELDLKVVELLLKLAALETKEPKP